MNGTFKIGEVGEYTPQNVEENDFLNDKLESDTYGIYYSVKFSGDAETYLMQAKKAPVEGEAEWGHIEMSKSGKSLRFKRDKREERHQSTSAPKKEDYEPGTNARWAIGMAYRAYIQVMGSPEGADGDFPFEAVEQHAKKLVEMFDKIKDSGSAGSVPSFPATPPIKDEETHAADLKSKVESWKKSPPASEQASLDEMEEE